MRKPGLGLTVGLSETNHTPYAHLSGRLLGVKVSKRIDPTANIGQLLIAAVAGLVAVKAKGNAQAKVSAKKGRVKVKSLNKVSDGNGGAVAMLLNPAEFLKF